MPFLMTALTAAFALVPIVLVAGEPGNEIQAPMAAVILALDGLDAAEPAGPPAAVRAAHRCGTRAARRQASAHTPRRRGVAA